MTEKLKKPPSRLPAGKCGGFGEKGGTPDPKIILSDKSTFEKRARNG